MAITTGGEAGILGNLILERWQALQEGRRGYWVTMKNFPNSKKRTRCVNWYQNDGYNAKYTCQKKPTRITDIDTLPQLARYTHFIWQNKTKRHAPQDRQNYHRRTALRKSRRPITETDTIELRLGAYSYSLFSAQIFCASSVHTIVLTEYQRLY
jgi:hypothetical protein